jgi:hypothetical protein
VPPEQGYPNGLVFHAGKEPFLLDDLVIFRGMDVEPPAAPAGLTAQREGDKLVLSWRRSEDNTITAYYRVYAEAEGKAEVVAETHRLSATLDPGKAAGRALAVTALDLYGNESARSETVQPR